jgi:hypothetical protein
MYIDIVFKIHPITAVYSTYGIYEFMHAYGKMCHRPAPDTAPEIVNENDTMIDRMTVVVSLLYQIYRSISIHMDPMHAWAESSSPQRAIERVHHWMCSTIDSYERK